jgi:hypothetical protein
MIKCSVIHATLTNFFFGIVEGKITVCFKGSTLKSPGVIKQLHHNSQPNDFYNLGTHNNRSNKSILQNLVS